MEVLFFSLSGACTIYFMIIVAYNGISTAFCPIWILLALIFMLMGIFRVRSKSRRGSLPSFLHIFIYTSFALGAGLFSFTMYLVMNEAGKHSVREVDYAIVMGDTISENGISASLRMRLDKAYEYYLRYPDTIFVLSGGRESGEPVPEAMAMYNYLFLKGIPEDNMLIETVSKTEREKIQNSGRLIERHFDEHKESRETEEIPSVGIITSDFNLYRAMSYAESDGFWDVSGIGTDTDLVLFPHECVREACALVGDFLTGAIK